MATRPGRVVVIDDEQSIREFICDLLAEEGYQVVGCQNSREGFAAIQHELPALIITDLWMQERYAGYDLLKQIRRTPGLETTPVILCAANQSFLREHAQQLRTLNCHPLEKPFNLDTLLAQVTALIGPAASPTIAGE